jgi:transposase
VAEDGPHSSIGLIGEHVKECRHEVAHRVPRWRHVRAVAQALGVRPDMLYQWKRQAEARVQQPVADVFTGSGPMMSQDEEIRRLRRENATLREERDVLGKATAFFAKYAR